MYLIKNELKAPFRDYERRFPSWQPLAGDRLFECLSGESQASLRLQQLVTVTVTSARANGANVKLESGLRGFIRLEDLSDNAPDPRDLGSREEVEGWVLQRVQPGMTITARVKSVNTERLVVDLVCKGSALRSSIDEELERSWLEVRPDIRPEVSEYMFRGLTAEDLLLVEDRRAKKQSFIPRPIDHYLFQNLARQEAIDYLDGKEVGDCVIRPSSKGPANLTLTWKAAPETYFHVDVEERDKPGGQLALGQTLLIRDERFEDLDEIVHRFLEPMASYAVDLSNHKSFRLGSDDMIEGMLRDQLQEEKRAPYHVSPANDRVGTYVFSYIGNHQVHRERIVLTQDGFLFKTKTFTDPNKLINYIKYYIAKKVRG